MSVLARLPRVLALAGILAVAALARFPLTDYGRPHVYHPDEVQQMHDPVRFLDSVRRANFTLPMSAVGWLFLAAIGACAVAARARGVFSSWAAAARAFLREDFGFFLWTRRLVAATSLACVLLCGWLAQAVFASSSLALLASALYAVSLVDVSSAHWVKQDVPVNLCLLVAQIALVRLAGAPRRRDWIAAGAAVGLAVGARGNTLPLLASLVPLVRRPPREGSPSGRPRFGELLATAVATYLVITLRPLVWAATALGQTPVYPTQPYEEVLVRRYQELMGAPASVLAQVGSNLVFYLDAAATTTGWPFLALAAVGIAAALRHPSPAVRQLGLVPIAYVPFLLPVRVRETRYLLPLLPYGCILGSWVVWSLARRFGRRSRLAGAGAGLVLGGCLLVEAARPTLAYVAFLRHHTDTRTAAARWIDGHVPPGSVIAVEKYHELPNLLPPLVESERQMRMKIEAERRLGLGSGRVREAWLEAYPTRSFTIISLSARPVFGSPWGAELENAYDGALLRRQGVSYVLLADHAAAERSPAFAAQLRREGERLERFESDAPPRVRRLLAATGGFLDPSLEIWRLRDAGARPGESP